jgi:hypothetical protein
MERTGVGARRVLWVLLAAAFLVAAGVVVSHYARTAQRPDLIAFYCGGQVVAQGGDPYELQPLATCEHELAGNDPGVIRPVPVPGYDLAVLALPAMMSFHAFAALYIALTIAALLVAAFSLGRLLGLTRTWLVLASLVPIALLCVRYGQLLPLISVAAICVSALYLSRKQYVGASIAIAVAMCEPHMGLPAALALLLFVPRARMPVIVCGAVLAIISVAALGLAANVQYVRAELPSQARAEIGFPAQFSLSWALHAWGAGNRLAIVAGTLSFLIALVVLLWAAQKIASRTGELEALVLLPPSASLCGGVFLHIWNVMVAIPAAIYLIYRYSGVTWVRGLALLLVMVPWAILASWPLRSPFLLASMAMALICGAYIGTQATRNRVGIAAFSVGAAIFTFALVSIFHIVRMYTGDAATGAETVGVTYFSPTTLASSYWGTFLHASYPALSGFDRWFASKLATWFGLLILVAVVIRQAIVAREPVARVSFEASVTPAVDGAVAATRVSQSPASPH